MLITNHCIKKYNSGIIEVVVDLYHKAVECWISDDKTISVYLGKSTGYDGLGELEGSSDSLTIEIPNGEYVKTIFRDKWQCHCIWIPKALMQN